MRLLDLVQGIVPEQAALQRLAADLPAGGLARDSRAVRPGDLFVAVPGVRVDGATFAAEAERRGAAAIVAERPLPGVRTPTLVVPDAALTLGLLADRREGEPSRSVAVTGVTGTNGKTTTSFLLSWILEAAGRPSSLLGTVCTRVAGRERASTMTTPDVLELHRALAETRDAGARDLVMEVSSHALHQRRTAGARFRCAVFTNLTRDHLDYHGSLEAYGDAKALLFEGLEPDATAVLNQRDAFGQALAARTRARVLRYAWSSGPTLPDADVAARLVSEGLFGTRLELAAGGTVAPLNLPVVGRFNVENALAAASAALALGVPFDAVRAALEASQGVPGRLERVSGARDGEPTVLVDYAHTPDALERVLETLRPLVAADRRLIVVFGCGGERDAGKRAPMGQAVERWADLALLTNDNPRGEEPAAIVRDVLAGCARPEQLRVVLDREAAIAEAVAGARPGDLVLIAGKGHEGAQVIGGRALPFDDRLVARRALAAV